MAPVTQPIHPLTRLVVNLLPCSVNALERAAAISGDSKTDVVNRALQIYAFHVAEVMGANRQILLRDADGNLEEVTWT